MSAFVPNAAEPLRRLDNDLLLLTLPSYDYCDLVDGITLVARDAEEWAEVDFEREYLITDVQENEPGQFDFISGDEIAADIKCDRWEYRIERK